MRSLLGRFHRPNARSQSAQLFMLNNLGDGSTLSLDFTTGVLDSRLTFTRSTTGTYINSSGYVTSAAINTARFDYDPTTLAARGLLIEGSSTNSLARSEDMATVAFPGWGNRQNLTSVTSGFTAPDGNTTAVKIIPNTTAASTHYLGTGTLSVTAQAYTYSCFVKTSGYTVVGLVATASQSRASFDLSSLSSAGYGISNTRTITSYPGGWYRISMTWTATVNTPDFWIVVQNTVQDPVTGWTGNATDGILAWGAQLEAGSGASSYIPTGASTGTRAADECVMTGTNFSSWFNATEGTFLAHARRIRTTDIGRIASANDNTANESIDIGADTTGEFIVTDGGSALATISPGTVTANTAFKIAGAFKLNDVQAALGGTLGTADTSATMPTVNQLMIGRQAGASPVYLNGTVSVLKFWPTRLANAQLQSLTT